jgi:nitroreductase
VIELELMDAIRSRRSIRKYKPDPVSDDVLRNVLEAARLAPSWANRQCWRFVVVKDKEKRKKITMRDWAAEAPVVIVGCADPTASGTKFNQQYYMLDMGIAMEHLMLAATELGLGTCWIGGQFDEPTVKRVLNIPEGLRVVALTPLGYPDEKPEAKPRKSLSEIVSVDSF